MKLFEKKNVFNIKNNFFTQWIFIDKKIMYLNLNRVESSRSKRDLSDKTIRILNSVESYDDKKAEN